MKSFKTNLLQKREKGSKKKNPVEFRCLEKKKKSLVICIA